MADFGIWTKNDKIQAKAGANVSATLKLTAETDKYVLQVEAFVNAATRYNWSDKVTSGLDADVQGILEEITTNLCAIYVIQADMGSGNRIEMEDRVNILRDAAFRGLSVLRDKKVQTFMLAV